MGVGEELADELLGSAVVALPEADVADVPLGVDEVVGRPVLVVVRVPGAVVVVDGDRVVHAQLRRLRLRTLETTCSKANSGVCTPTTTKPSFA